jgi:hypothetical protein
MASEVWSRILIAALPVVAGLVQAFRRPGGVRDQLKKDIELYNALPDESEAKVAMKEHLKRQVDRLMSAEGNPRRDPTGIGLGLAFLGVGAVILYTGLHQSSWQWLYYVAGGLLFIFGAASFGNGVSERPRSDSGRVVKTDS